MITLGLISDTHGWLDPAIADWFGTVDTILHAGDVGNEATLLALQAVAPTVAVRGNVDGGPWAQALPTEVVHTVGERRIGLRHIAGSPRRPTRDALTFIARARPDVLLVGHSHIAVVQWRDGVLWINPGAAGRQGFQKERTIMKLYVGEKLDIDVISLGKR
ncbi:MAG: metallophosphoesterase family protein [Anaerolineales bacterium]|nr:metallophosphoesterase family protein [Anaerolineales bacterium]MCB9129110.1 metallophosphoesterase family protein [Ardenticatenales bacterium]